MKAVVLYGYGGPEKLIHENAPRPSAREGEVQIRIHAAAVNPVDWKIREGQLKSLVPHVFPLIPGWDLSGVIEDVGPGTTRFKAGDEVFSHPDILRDGAYAEFIVVRESEVAPKPKSLDHVHAAAIPLTGLTAWQALFDAGKLAGGQRILIHGAAGSVGSSAVQLARWKGARVIGTGSARSRTRLRQIGVDEFIDHEARRFEEVARGVDMVLDTVGGETQERSWKTLKPGGILVSILSPPAEAEAATHSARAAFVITQPNGVQLAELARLVDAGHFKPLVKTILPLSGGRRAQELSQAGHTRGKIVLQVA